MRMVLALAALALAVPAYADEPAPTATQAAKPPKPKKVCRTPPSDTSSRIGPPRVCHTEAEWAEIDARGEWPPANGSNRAVRSGTVRY